MDITKETIENKYCYNPITGQLISRRTGKPTKGRDCYGYLVVKWGTALVKVHRLIAVLKLGLDYADKSIQVDHLNGLSTDNRLCNLRLCTVRENQQNRKQHREGKLVGVTALATGWMANIRIDGKCQYLGTYTTDFEAAQAYAEAVQAIIDGRVQEFLAKNVEVRKVMNAERRAERAAKRAATGEA